MLKLEGFDVRTAEDGSTGLLLAAEHPPNAILLDLRMPIMDGVEFLRRLRQTPGLAETPVAIVTGDYFVEERIGALLQDLGARLVFKPLWIDEIVALVKSLVDGPSAGQRDNH